MNQPIQGQVYALTGATGTPCIANGNTWEESRVEEQWKKNQEIKDAYEKEHTLKNDKIEVTFDGEDVHIFDRKDIYNDYKGFSQTKLASRAKKAFELLSKSFNDQMTFGQAVDILDNAGAKMHCYCGMD